MQCNLAVAVAVRQMLRYHMPCSKILHVIGCCTARVSIVEMSCMSGARKDDARELADDGVRRWATCHAKTDSAMFEGLKDSLERAPVSC